MWAQRQRSIVQIEVKTMDLLSPIYHFVREEVDDKFRRGSHSTAAIVFYEYVVHGTTTDISEWQRIPYMVTAMREVADFFAELLPVALDGLETIQDERLTHLTSAVNDKRSRISVLR